MTRSEQKFQKAVTLLKKEYIKAQAAVFVNKPMSYALYQVWKQFDASEKGRINCEEKARKAASASDGEQKHE